MPKSNDSFAQYAICSGSAVRPRSSAEALLGDLKCDVCVIGGGFVGLSSALHLAISGREVVVLEEASVGWGASGRNAGIVLPGFAVSMAEIRRALGDDHARQLWFLSVEAVELVVDLVLRYDIKCDFKAGHLTAALSARDMKEEQEAAADLQESYGYAYLRKVGFHEIREILASSRYVGGVLNSGAGHLNPLRLVNGLGSAVRSLGVRIFEQTRVTGVQFDDISGVAITATGRVRARQLVLATNAAVGRVIPHLKARVFCAHSLMISTAPLNEAARAVIRDDISVNDTAPLFDYYRLSSDRRLLFGGGLRIVEPSSHNIRMSVRRRMLRVFPQLADTAIDHAWSGTLDMTANLLPDVGRLSKSTYYAQGFSGHGIALSLLCGVLIAESIDGRDHRFKIFEKIKHKSRVGTLPALLRTGISMFLRRVLNW